MFKDPGYRCYSLRDVPGEGGGIPKFCRLVDVDDVSNMYDQRVSMKFNSPVSVWEYNNEYPDIN